MHSKTDAMPKINRLKMLLRERNLTNRWLSIQLDVDPTTVSKWCTNSSQPDILTLLKIANLLGVEVKDLYDRGNCKGLLDLRRITKDMINYPIRIIITLCLAVVVLTIIGCDRQSIASEKMDLAESLMDSRPDSALSILNAVNVETLNGKKDKARYALLKSMALDKNYIDTTSFDVLQPAIDYFLKKGTADEKLKTYYYQGRIYQNRENNDSAMQSFMRGREYCGQASDTMTMANLLVAQGTILYTTYKFDDFIKVNLEAAELYRESGRPDYEILSIANVLDGSILNGDQNLADSIMSIAI